MADNARCGICVVPYMGVLVAHSPYNDPPSYKEVWGVQEPVPAVNKGGGGWYMATCWSIYRSPPPPHIRTTPGGMPGRKSGYGGGCIVWGRDGMGQLRTGKSGYRGGLDMGGGSMVVGPACYQDIGNA